MLLEIVGRQDMQWIGGGGGLTKTNAGGGSGGMFFQKSLKSTGSEMLIFSLNGGTPAP